MTHLDLWSTILRAPFSGDVSVKQDIQPSLWSNEIKGIPAIEDRIQTDVASFGKQLGKILEALQLLADKAGIELTEIDAIVNGVEEVKRQSREELRAEAVAALERLRKVDEPAWRDVTGRG